MVQKWQAHTSTGGAKSVKMSSKGDLVLSGSADDVCIYSLETKKAQLTCWNSSEVTASDWIDSDTFIVGEATGPITIDRAYPRDFRKVSFLAIISISTVCSREMGFLKDRGFRSVVLNSGQKMTLRALSVVIS